jgi:hypothetical protein
LLSLLPEHIHPNPVPDPTSADQTIAPLPESFVRYSTDWQDAVRGFQRDLGDGRYEPEWQAEAAQAMEERANGTYDSFKEQQYEEFWGQKQKLSYDVVTGDSAQVKLEVLVQQGLVRVGDIWKFSRGFSKPSPILVEKEAKVSFPLFLTVYFKPKLDGLTCHSRLYTSTRIMLLHLLFLAAVGFSF